MSRYSAIREAGTGGTTLGGGGTFSAGFHPASGLGGSRSLAGSEERLAPPESLRRLVDAAPLEDEEEASGICATASATASAIASVRSAASWTARLACWAAASITASAANAAASSLKGDNFSIRPGHPCQYRVCT